MPRRKQDLFTPQLAATIFMPQIKAARALPDSVDDAVRKEGWDLYDKMATNVFIWSATMYLRARIYESGLSISPAIEPPPFGTPETSDAAQEFAKAVEVAAFCSYAIESLEHKTNSLAETLRKMHSWVRYGASLAEFTVERIKEGDHAGMQRFDCVRYIPRRNYRMVVTPYGETLGAIGYVPEVGGGPLVNGLIPNPETFSNFVPIERLLYMVVNPDERGPFGESVYRAAYRPWKAVNLIEPVELQNMFNFASENMVFTAPEGAEAIKKLKFADQERMGSLLELMQEILSNFQPNNATILPNGTQKIDLGQSDTQAFEDFAKRKAGELVMSVLYSARTLMESNRNSQADAGQAQDVADAAVASAQEVIAPAIRHQLLRPLVTINYGRDVADKMTPSVSLRKVTAGDTSKMLTALGNAYRSGAITDGMLHNLWPYWFGVKYIPNESLKRPTAGEPRSLPQDELEDDSEQ